MKKPVAKNRGPVPWYRKKRFVQIAGSITGFLVMGWISIFIVYHSSVSLDNSIQLSLNPTSLDKDAFMSSFHRIYRPRHQVETYYWPKDSPIIEAAKRNVLPMVISVANLPDWHRLYKWASGSDWVVHSDVEYDFQAQNTPVFRQVDASSPYASSVPLPLIDGESTVYLRLNDFFKSEFEGISEIDGVPKFKKFEGFVQRKGDGLSEFPDSPLGASTATELKGKSVKLTVLSHRAQTLPYLTLSGQIVMQAVGTSDWLLSPPTEASKYSFYPALHPLAFQTQIGAPHLSASGLYGIDLNSDLLTGATTDEIRRDISLIEADFIRLIPGQILVIPPYWTAQSLASATSVTVSMPIYDTVDLEVRLKAIRNYPRFTDISNTISEVMKAESSSKVQEGDETTGHKEGEVDPELWLREKLLSLIRILNTALAGEEWYSTLLDSYETFHTQIASVKADFAHRVIGKACSISEVISDGQSSTLDSKLRAKLSHHESEVSSLLKSTLDQSSERHIAASLVAESALYAVLQETESIHSFLHECESLWIR